MISDCGHKYISAFKPSQQVTGEWWFFPDKLYNSTINPFLFLLLYFCFAFIYHFIRRHKDCFCYNRSQAIMD
jgi:ATP/ADP translocase